MLVIVYLHATAMAQMGTPTPLPPKEREKAEAERKASGPLTNYPQLVDITGFDWHSLSTSIEP